MDIDIATDLLTRARDEGRIPCYGMSTWERERITAGSGHAWPTNGDLTSVKNRRIGREGGGVMKVLWKKASGRQYKQMDGRDG